MKKLTFALITMAILSSCGTSKKELQSNISDCQKKVEEVKKENEEISEESEEKSKKIKTLKKEIREVNDSITKLSSATLNAARKGVYYRIQLGASKKLSSDPTNTSFVVKEGNYYKWRIGYFSSYEEAKKATIDLKRFGHKNFWIVPMKDGEVITYKQAKNLLEESKKSDR